MDALGALWSAAGLQSVTTREIIVQRTFDDFEDFWSSSTITGSTRPAIAALTAGDRETLRARLRARLPADARGPITYAARANAIQGRVPA
jgi:hypothetical protein